MLLQKDPKVILSDSKAKTEEKCVVRIYEHKLLFKRLVALKDVFGLNKGENIKALRSMGYSKTQKSKLKKREKIKNNVKNQKLDWVEEDIENEETVRLDENNASVTKIDEISSGTEKVSIQVTQKNESVQEKPKQKLKTTSQNPPKIKKVEFSSESEVDDTDQVERSADSFFITTSGENYLATVTKNNLEEDHQYKRTYKEDDDYEVETRITQHTERKNYESNKQQSRNRPYDRPVRNSNRDFPERRPFEHNRPSQTVNQHTEENLHPSWKAKQQQRVIQPFQGKKFKFDDESDAIPSVKHPSSNYTTNDLHPSWAAKMKAKPVIAEFVGNKIRFDDD